MITYQWYKDGVIIVGATSASYIISAADATDAASYTVVVTDGGGNVTSAPITLMVAMCILDAIEMEMAALIAGIRKADGYNFDWGIVNEQDESIGDFPRCVIDPTETVADKEINQDSLAGTGSRDYTNEVMFTLLVKGELPAFSDNPLFAIRSFLRLALDDFKKLFGTYLNLESQCDNIMYSGSQIESLVRNDIQRPAQLRTFWKVVYSQDRRIPTQYASS